MTVWVDDVYLQGNVPGVRSNARWCHLMADTELELKEFGDQVGISRNWIQDQGNPGKVHFDVTKSVRARCVEAGAVELPWHYMAELMRAKRRIHAAENDPNYGTLESCWEECSSCGILTVLVGPYCDAANIELYLCEPCIIQVEDA